MSRASRRRRPSPRYHPVTGPSGPHSRHGVARMRHGTAAQGSTSRPRPDGLPCAATPQPLPAQLRVGHGRSGGCCWSGGAAGVEGLLLLLGRCTAGPAPADALPDVDAQTPSVDADAWWRALCGPAPADKGWCRSTDRHLFAGGLYGPSSAGSAGCVELGGCKQGATPDCRTSTLYQRLVCNTSTSKD